eukprot:161524-Rhodomonas_salina.2
MGVERAAPLRNPHVLSGDPLLSMTRVGGEGGRWGWRSTYAAAQQTTLSARFSPAPRTRRTAAAAAKEEENRAEMRAGWRQRRLGSTCGGWRSRRAATTAAMPAATSTCPGWPRRACPSATSRSCAVRAATPLPLSLRRPAARPLLSAVALRLVTPASATASLSARRMRRLSSALLMVLTGRRVACSRVLAVVFVSAHSLSRARS